MTRATETVISLVKRGDTLEITPIDKLPNFDRKIKVDYVTKDGFIYGMSSTCDGYLYPFYAIKDCKIVL